MPKKKTVAPKKKAPKKKGAVKAKPRANLIQRVAREARGGTAYDLARAWQVAGFR